MEWFCPLNLNCGVFTVGAPDNIDYNLSSTTAQWSFHGTGISLFQFPSSSVDGTQSRPPITLPPGKPDRNIHLPESYTTVPAISVKTTELAVSKTAYTEAFSGNLHKQWRMHFQLQTRKFELLTSLLGQVTTDPWTGHHLFRQSSLDSCPCSTKKRLHWQWSNMEWRCRDEQRHT